MLAFLIKLLLGFSLVVNYAYGLNSNSEEIDSAFESYKIQFGKKYATPEEEEKRKEAFTDTYLYIQEYYNKYQFKLQLNDISDRTDEERRASSGPAPPRPDPYKVKSNSTKLIKSSWDWRKDWKKNAVTSVKNQGSCGSCWAFTGIATIESRRIIAGYRKRDFSEQHILSCGYPDTGCAGLYINMSYVWVQNKGLVLDECYPYDNGDFGENQIIPKCKRIKDKSCWFSAISSYDEVDNPAEDDMANEVAQNGPIGVSICEENSWTNWPKGGGIYQNTEGTCNDYDHCNNINGWHAITIIGYGSDGEGQDYWIIKNSYGPTFADNGYIKMWRNSGLSQGQCLIAAWYFKPNI